MPGRPLDADEALLWRRVMATVRPLRAVARSAPRPSTVPQPVCVDPEAKAPPASSKAPPVREQRVKPKPPVPGTTLDGGWDRRLSKGVVAPDDVIDLHGHTLASAHALLDRRLDEAVRGGDRVILLVTGKPPRAESERPHARGAIRAAVTDWLVASRHAGHIAAVRGAHPRHGGAGALYIVLRRARGS
jgi:DNA-nicking Smr family endonuclease